jgi:hypothetical protein
LAGAERQVRLCDGGTGNRGWSRLVRLLVAILVVAAAGGGPLALGARAGAGASAWPGCDGFDTQAEAQAY